MTTLVGLPAWLVVLVSAAGCASLAIGFRWILRHHLGDDVRSTSLVAGPLMPALGAVFALLTATTLSAEATQFRSAEDNVSAEAAAASRMAWAATSPGIDTVAIQKELVSYLRLTRLHEWSGGDSDGSPAVMTALSALERTVRTEAAQEEVGSAQGGELLGALDSLTSLRRQRLATRANELPDLYLIVVLMSGLALIANSAALALDHRPRVAALTAGLVVVVALAMALLLAISAPFSGGFIVDGGPIDVIRASLAAGGFQP
ncbi:DUF4239 domain-containing protein [Aquihabitans sp. McL0605]|uniref:bestrophin-like domain n=1 Tax=Aquihabitans sp. McL0605 TaxID=3415671 RepID=UPI003CFA9D12